MTLQDDELKRIDSFFNDCPILVVSGSALAAQHAVPSDLAKPMLNSSQDTQLDSYHYLQ